MTIRKLSFLLLTVASIVYVPYIALYYMKGGIPEGYFKYPPIDIRIKPEPTDLAMLISSIILIAILLLYFFPQVYGFKKNLYHEPIVLKKKYLPVWFWIGLVMFTVPLVLFSIQAPEPKWLLNWALLPLFWGFTLFLDGIVFYIDDGNSFFSKSPTELLSLGVASISGWLLFDYLNFYIDRNWVYPKAGLVDATNNEFIVYAFLGSSGFFPMAFQWYSLLRKVKILNTKYKFGPKIKTPKWLLYALIIISLFGLVVLGITDRETSDIHNNLFFIIWLAPLIIVTSALTLIGVWTPFTPLKEGNWTALLTFALTYLVQGVILECWNYMSGEHIDGKLTLSYNCAYWVYCIPFVDKYHIFEMPFFGYMGYLFFSVHCYVWWITISKAMGVATPFTDEEDLK